jgi:hypothetical protein
MAKAKDHEICAALRDPETGMLTRQTRSPEMKRGAPDDKRTPIFKDDDDQTNQTRRLTTRGGGHE